MRKFGFILACVAVLCVLPKSLTAGHFSFNVLFDATALFCRPCLPPPVIERHVYVTPPPVPYYGGTTVIKEYRNPYCCCERRVIVTRPCWVPCYPCIPY